MKIFTLSMLITLLSLQSCKKDSLTTSVREEYIHFLTINEDYVDGKINDQNYRWQVNINDYVKTDSIVNGQQKSQFFGFYTTLCDAKVEIYTPYYETKSQLFNQILSKGKKQIGGGDDGFSIKVTLPIGHLQTYGCVGTYTTNGDQSMSYIEVLKSENVFDSSTQKNSRRVWLKFKATLYNETTNKTVDYKEGVLIARFSE